MEAGRGLGDAFGVAQKEPGVWKAPFFISNRSSALVA